MLDESAMSVSVSDSAAEQVPLLSDECALPISRAKQTWTERMRDNAVLQSSPQHDHTHTLSNMHTPSSITTPTTHSPLTPFSLAYTHSPASSITSFPYSPTHTRDASNTNAKASRRTSSIYYKRSSLSSVSSSTSGSCSSSDDSRRVSVLGRDRRRDSDSSSLVSRRPDSRASRRRSGSLKALWLVSSPTPKHRKTRTRTLWELWEQAARFLRRFVCLRVLPILCLLMSTRFLFNSRWDAGNDGGLGLSDFGSRQNGLRELVLPTHINSHAYEPTVETVELRWDANINASAETLVP